MKKASLMKTILEKFKSIIIVTFFANVLSCNEQSFSNQFLLVQLNEQTSQAKIEGWVEVIDVIGSRVTCNDSIAYSSFYKVVTSIDDTCIIISPCDQALFQKGERAWFFPVEELRVLKVASDTTTTRELLKYSKSIGKLAIPEE